MSSSEEESDRSNPRRIRSAAQYFEIKNEDVVVQNFVILFEIDVSLFDSQS